MNRIEGNWPVKRAKEDRPLDGKRGSTEMGWIHSGCKFSRCELGNKQDVYPIEKGHEEEGRGV